jgi:hypothetical protein
MAYIYGSDGSKKPFSSMKKPQVRENYQRDTTSETSSPSKLLYWLLFLAVILGALLWFLPSRKKGDSPVEMAESSPESSSMAVPSEGEPMRFGFRFY